MSKRIQFSQYGSADVLQYVDSKITAPNNNEVQVANKAIGVNFIDTYYRSGLYSVPALPCGLGSEAAGVVTHVGQDVRHFQVGDRVVYGQSTLGAYSEQHNVDAQKVVKLPSQISFEQAAAVFMKGLTVYYLFSMTFPLKKGDIFLFHAAAGGVGLIACQWAKAIGAKLIGTVGSDEKAAAAKQAGAFATINYRKNDVLHSLLDINNNNKVDVVYDSVGKSTWVDSLKCLNPRGLMVSFGNASGPVNNIDLAILNQYGGLYVTRPSLLWYINSSKKLHAAADTLFNAIISGDIIIDVPKTQQFALADAMQAHQLIESRKTLGSTILIP